MTGNKPTMPATCPRKAEQLARYVRYRREMINTWFFCAPLNDSQQKSFEAPGLMDVPPQTGACWRAVPRDVAFLRQTEPRSVLRAPHVPCVEEGNRGRYDR